MPGHLNGPESGGFASLPPEIRGPVGGAGAPGKAPGPIQTLAQRLPLVVPGMIGMGVQPPIPEWGSMLAEGRDFMRYSPYITLFPGLAIILTSLSLNLLGDGLRDALDPRLKK